MRCSSKISRLARTLRNRLNQRLENGEQKKLLILWLNSLVQIGLRLLD